jgi:hypothetical protein
MAAGRPASLPSVLPALFFTGCGQVMPRLCQMLHQRQEERQIAFGNAPLIERQNEIAAAGVDQEIRVLDTLGNAFIGQQLADVVIVEEAGKLFRSDIGVNRH